MNNETEIRWPTASDYSQAVQSPGQTLTGQGLRGLEPVFGPMGVPLSASGQNAIVFLLRNAQQEQFALRCFTTLPVDAESRYGALAQHIEPSDSSWIASAEWIADGIEASRRQWPVVLMPWVPGRPLNLAAIDAVEEGNGETISELVDRWSALMVQLEDSGMAHGDLQHGNVLVDHGSTMTLVDLDGVWLPGDQLSPPNEFGHPNYQHPERTVNHWGQHIDSFSALVVEVSLRSLRADPSLQDLSAGENLLFMRQDFVDPDNSSTFDRVTEIADPEITARSERLKQLCRAGIEHSLVPFSDLLGLERTVLREVPKTEPAASAPAAVLPEPALESAGAEDWWVDSAPTSNTKSRSSVPPPKSAGMPISSAPVPAKAVSGGHAQPKAATSWFGHDADVRNATKSKVAFGLGSLEGGVVGGVLGGAIACLIYAALYQTVPTSIQAGFFVMLVSPLVGLGVLATQPFLVRQVRLGIRRGAWGACLGAAAGLLGLLVADPIFSAMMDGSSSGVGSISVASAVAWSIVAAFIGLALGATQSLKAALVGYWAGMIAGFIGGAAFGATIDEVSARRLVIDVNNPWTLLSTILVAGLVGGAVGASRKLGAAATARVIEGPSSGLEILLKSTLTVGSAPDDELRIVGTGVVGHHAVIEIGEAGCELTANGPLDIDGTPHTGGARVELRSGAVLRIGPSFIRINHKMDEA